MESYPSAIPVVAHPRIRQVLSPVTACNLALSH